MLAKIRLTQPHIRSIGYHLGHQECGSFQMEVLCRNGFMQDNIVLTTAGPILVPQFINMYWSNRI
jgi:hypothetical protein